MTSSITPLRISPGVTPDSHPSIATRHSRSKFGLPASATAADRLIEMLTRGSVRLRGIHMHLGSQIRDLRVYETAVRTVAPYLRARDLPELCLGGGLAVACTAREAAPSITEFAQTVGRGCADTLHAVRLTCELCRWMVAPAAVTLYTVGTVKRSPDGATIAAVDGRMTDNMRVALYGAEYEVLARGRPHGPARPVTVVGKHCESGDVLAGPWGRRGGPALRSGRASAGRPAPRARRRPASRPDPAARVRPVPAETLTRRGSFAWVQVPAGPDVRKGASRWLFREPPRRRIPARPLTP